MSGRELASQKGRGGKDGMRGWASLGDVSGVFGPPSPCLSDTWDVQEGAQFGISALKALGGVVIGGPDEPPLGPAYCSPCPGVEGTPGKKLILETKAEGEYSFPGLANAKTPQPSPSSSPEQKDTGTPNLFPDSYGKAVSPGARTLGTSATPTPWGASRGWHSATRWSH